LRTFRAQFLKLFFGAGMYIYLLIVVSLFVCQVQAQDAALPTDGEPNGIVSLGDVFALTLMRNPTLSAFSYEIRAQEAFALQSSLLPNPELGVATENFGGTGATKGFDSAETTIEVSQLIELAGKRAKRTQVAKFDTELAEWDYKAKRLDLFSEAAKAFADVLAAQERIALAKELNKLAEEVKYAVSQRVAAGKEPPLEEAKADVSLAASQIALENSHRSLDIARTKLASFWGSFNPQFAGLKGDIYDVRPHGTLEEFAAKITGNPDVARWTAEMNQRRASVALEKAKAVPDITVSAGPKYLAEPRDTAFVAGVSIPLPIFDRNQGNISAARARLNKTRELARQADVAAKTDLVNAYKSMLSAYEQTVNLKKKIIPASQQAFDAASEGYRQGKFGYLDLLDAQRTLFQARQQYLDMLVLYHQTHADVERLIGGNMEFEVNQK
jgi:cobalt-zinc-cadmium efflux system outer membrane protein